MGFFKEFKDDLSGAVNEIVTGDNDAVQDSTAAVQEEASKSEAAANQEQSETRFGEDAEVAVITKGLKIKGDIECNGAIEIYGTIEGSIHCDGKLVICGDVTGDSETQEFFANKAMIHGNITSHGNAKIGQGTKIIGDVTAGGVVVAGAVKGTIDVQGPVILDSTAVVVGDIKSRSIQINNGAIIDGHFSQCYADASAVSYFEEN